MSVERPSELRVICQAGKNSDPRWYFVHRRVSIYITWLLLHTSIRPNQITLLMMATGVAGAALLVPQVPAVNAVGFVVLYLAFLLDKVDGEIARYRRQSSARGVLLDRLHHLMIEPLIFLAAAWHDWNDSHRLGVWMAAWAVVVLGNIVDEHQHLSAYILFKHLKRTHTVPATGDRTLSRRLSLVLRLMRPLKAFRMFIVAVPALALAYAFQAWTQVPAIGLYLYASTIGLGAFLAFQAYYYFQFKLEAEIGEQAAFLAEDVGHAPEMTSIVRETERQEPLRAAIHP